MHDAAVLSCNNTENYWRGERIHTRSASVEHVVRFVSPAQYNTLGAGLGTCPFNFAFVNEWAACVFSTQEIDNAACVVLPGSDIGLHSHLLG